MKEVTFQIILICYAFVSVGGLVIFANHLVPAIMFSVMMIAMFTLALLSIAGKFLPEEIESE